MSKKNMTPDDLERMRKTLIEDLKSKLQNINTKRSDLLSQLQSLNEETVKLQQQQSLTQSQQSQSISRHQQQQTTNEEDGSFEESMVVDNSEEEEEEETKPSSPTSITTKSAKQKKQQIGKGTSIATTTTTTTTATATTLSSTKRNLVVQLPPIPKRTWLELANSLPENALPALYERAIARAQEIRATGLWKPKLPPKQPDPPRQKVHWDLLLDEMSWMAKDFDGERKWKKAIALILATECASAVIERNEKLKQQYYSRRKLAYKISEQVSNFWKKMSQQQQQQISSSIVNSNSNSNSSNNKKNSKSTKIMPKEINRRPLSILRKDSSDWLLNATSSQSQSQMDYILCDNSSGLIGISSIASLLKQSTSLPSIVLVQHSSLLLWRLGLERNGIEGIDVYTGGSPCIPRLHTLTTFDIAASENESLGKIPWTVAVIVIPSSLSINSTSDTLKIMSNVCHSCASASIRVFLTFDRVDENSFQTIISPFLRGSPVISAWDIQRATTKSRNKEEREEVTSVIHRFIGASLSKRQVGLYKEIQNKIPKELEVENAVDILENLRTICNHPDIQEELNIRGSPFVCYEPLFQMAYSLEHICNRSFTRFSSDFSSASSKSLQTLLPFQFPLQQISLLSNYYLNPLDYVPQTFLDVAMPRALAFGKTSSNDSQIVSSSVLTIATNFLSRNSDLVSSSGKFRELLSLLQELQSEKKRVCLISHSFATRNLLAKFLLASNLNFVRADFTSNENISRIACHSFDMDPDAFILLAIPKMLCPLHERCLDSVVIFDVDWNQDSLTTLFEELSLLSLTSSNVTVHWLYSENTIEEFVLSLTRKMSREEISSEMISSMKSAGISLERAQELSFFAELTKREALLGGDEQGIKSQNVVSPLRSYAISLLSEQRKSKEEEESTSAPTSIEMDAKEKEKPAPKTTTSTDLLPVSRYETISSSLPPLFYDCCSSLSLASEIKEKGVIQLPFNDQVLVEPYIPLLDEYIHYAVPVFVVIKKKKKKALTQQQQQQQQQQQKKRQRDDSSSLLQTTGSNSPLQSDTDEYHPNERTRSRDDDVEFDESEELTDEEYQGSNSNRNKRKRIPFDPEDAPFRPDPHGANNAPKKRKQQLLQTSAEIISAQQQNKQEKRRRSHKLGAAHPPPPASATSFPVIPPPPVSSCWTPEADQALREVCSTYGINWRMACDHVREVSGRQITPNACFRRWSLLENRNPTFAATTLPTPMIRSMPYNRWKTLNDIFETYKQKQLQASHQHQQQQQHQHQHQQQLQNSTAGQPNLTIHDLPIPHKSHEKIIAQQIAQFPQMSTAPRLPAEITNATYLRIDTAITAPRSMQRMPLPKDIQQQQQQLQLQLQQLQLQQTRMNVGSGTLSASFQQLSNNGKQQIQIQQQSLSNAIITPIPPPPISVGRGTISKIMYPIGNSGTTAYVGGIPPPLSQQQLQLQQQQQQWRTAQQNANIAASMAITPGLPPVTQSQIQQFQQFQQAQLLGQTQLQQLQQQQQQQQLQQQQQQQQRASRQSSQTQLQFPSVSAQQQQPQQQTK